MPHTFRDADEASAFDSIGEFFADDVVFRSPIAHRPYQGRDALSVILTAVSRVFEDFTYEREIKDAAGGDHALIFNARVGDLAIQGCDFLHYNDEGLIDQFTVMLRPLKAVLAFEERMRVEFARAMTEANGVARADRCKERTP